MKTPPSTRLLLAGALGSLALSAAAQTTLYWNTTEGGDGTWDNTSILWATTNTILPNAAWGTSGGDIANLLKAEADITVAETIAVDGITVITDTSPEINSWSLNGGTFDMESDGLDFLIVHDGDPSGGKIDDPTTNVFVGTQITGSGGLGFEVFEGFRNANQSFLTLANAGNDFTGGILIDANKGSGNGRVNIRTNVAGALSDGNVITLQKSGGGWPGIEFNFTGTLENEIVFSSGATQDGFGDGIAVWVTGGNILTIDSDGLLSGPSARTFGGSGETRFTFADSSTDAGQIYNADQGHTLTLTRGDQLGTGSRVEVFDGSTLKGDGTFTLNNEIELDRGDNNVWVTTGHTMTLTDFGNTSDRRTNRNWEKVGPGTLDLDDPDGWDGDGMFSTEVIEGTLLVNNETGSATGASRVTVFGNTTFGGAGRISPWQASNSGNPYNFLEVLPFGTVTPGNGAETGTLDIDLSRTTEGASFEAFSTFEFDFGSTSNDMVAFTDDASPVDSGWDVSFNNNVIDFTDATSGSLPDGDYTLFTFDADTTYFGTLQVGSGLEAYGTATLSYNTSDIVLTLAGGGPPADPYGDWAASNITAIDAGADATFGGNPDGDPFDNGLEWILGGDPLGFDSTADLLAPTGDATTGLTLEFTREEDSIGEATLTVEFSDDLFDVDINMSDVPMSSGTVNGVTYTINDASDPDSVTANIPASNASSDGKLFGRVGASQ